MKIYSIYDNQTATYAPVFSVPHEMLAVRAFINLAQDRNSQIYAHPSAFNLMELASMDMETGMITPLAAPRNLGLASSFTQQDRENAG